MLIEKVIDRFELLLSLIMNLILISGFMISKLSKYSRNKLLKKFLHTEEVNIYFPGRDIGRNYPVVASEDFLAAYEMAEFIQQNGLKANLKIISPYKNHQFEKGSVVICGPKSSSSVRELLATDPCYQFIEDQDGIWKFQELSTHNILISPDDKSLDNQKDIAYLGRVRQNQDDNNQILLIAGIHAIGSYGVIKYLTSISTLKSIENITKGARFSTLIYTFYNKENMQVISSGIQMPIKKH